MLGLPGPKAVRGRSLLHAHLEQWSLAQVIDCLLLEWGGGGRNGRAMHDGMLGDGAEASIARVSVHVFILLEATSTRL